MLDERILEACRAGANRRCIDCGDDPLFGGLRCLPCFQHRCDVRSGGVHGCPRHAPSTVCYNQCGCRCHSCRGFETYRRKKAA